jgi:hypothetical protein
MQSGSKHERTRATTKKAETYRVNWHKWSGHPEPSRATLGHPGTSDWVNLPPSGHPTQVTGPLKTTQKTAREFAPNFRLMDLPNHLESWDEILWRRWTPQREVMPQKLRSQTPYNSWNSKSCPRTLWTRVHLKINELKDKFGIWGVKIIHKEAQGTHPWSPQRNPKRNSLELTNRATNKNPS